MKKRLCYRLLTVFCNLLIVSAPLIVTKSACLGLWGEPDVPDILKTFI